METKKLEIQQAVEGEKFNKTLYKFEDFKTELAISGINDIFSDTNIKQDKEKYIFSMNGNNIFAVEGKKNLVNWIQRFYTEKGEKDKRKAEQKVLIRIEGLELQYIESKTKEELDLLKNDIKKVEGSIDKATNIENTKFKVERLISFYEQEKDLAASESSGWIFNRKYDRKDKGLRNIHKTEVNRRLKELNKIKQQIERLAGNKDKKYTIDRDIDAENDGKKELKDVKMDDVNGMDMNTTLKQFSDRIDELGKEAPDFITSRNEIILEKGDTVPYYEIMIQDKGDARKLSRSLKKINKEYSILDKLELTAAKRQELSQDLQDLEAYLNNVIANPDTFKPSEHPFVPTHAKEFYELTKIDPTLAAFMKMNKDAKKTTDGTSSTQVGAGTGTETGTGTEKDKNSKEYATSPYSNTKEAFEKGGIGGAMKYWLDQTNMRPEQKQMWGGVGNLAVTGGLIFVGWKMISSAFKLFTKKGRSEENLGKNLGWLLGPSALIFGSQARSGEGPTKLFTGGKLTEKIAGLFGRGGGAGEKDKDNKEKSAAGIKYGEGVPGATAVFNGLNYGEMKQLVVKDGDGDHMKINSNKYDSLVDMFRSKKNEAGVKFLESIGKKDDKNMMDLALKGMGITRESLQDDSNKNKKFNESASKAIVRLGAVSNYMTEKGYNKINTETLPLVEKYIANENASMSDLETLDKRGDVFYKESTIVDKTGLEPKIKQLANNDKEKEEELLLAVNSFYEQMPSANKKIDISGTRPNITFKTYDQTTKMDLSSKAIDGFTTSKFDSYLETFKAANLTNRIKQICKDKEAKSEKPFYLSAGQDITFDNANIFSTDFDTEIMTAGWGGNLKNVSPILETYKKEYCDYLNNMSPKFWKEKPNN